MLLNDGGLCGVMGSCAYLVHCAIERGARFRRGDGIGPDTGGYVKLLWRGRHSSGGQHLLFQAPGNIFQGCLTSTAVAASTPRELRLCLTLIHKCAPAAMLLQRVTNCQDFRQGVCWGRLLITFCRYRSEALLITRARVIVDDW